MAPPEKSKSVIELSAEQLIAVGVTPVKREARRVITVKVAMEAVGGGSAGAPGQKANVKKKSKRQVRKERNETRATQLCHAFLKGECAFGDRCTFTHDVAAFVAAKPADLPGRCPYTATDGCPYGLMCRWARSHTYACALHDKWLRGKADVAPDQGDAGASGAEHAAMLAGAPAGADVAQTADVAQASADAAADPAAAAADVAADVAAGTLVLPVPAEVPPTLNWASRELIGQLRKETYDLSRADGLLKAKGYHIMRKGKGPNAGQGRKRGKRDDGEQPARKKPAKASTDEAAIAAMAEDAPEPAGAVQKQPAAEAASEPAAEPEATGKPPASCADDAQKPPGAAVEAAEKPPGAAAEAAEKAPGAAAEAAEKAPGAAAEAAEKAPGAAAEAGEKAPGAAAEAAEKPPGAAAEAGEKREIWSLTAADGRGETADARPRAGERKVIDFRGKLYLAPLTTVGNLPFRKILKDLGVDITCGEMAVCTNLLQGQPSEWALVKRHASEDCFGVQIAGGYPDSLARCAQLLDENLDVDFVDINMGCPIDVICNKGAGSSLIKRPARMRQLVEVTSQILRCPLTIKMRVGYNDGENVAHEIIPQTKEWGAAAVTLHGRSRAQRYSRKADWEYIKQCAEAAPGVTLIGNGDVFSYTDYDTHLREAGVATCMLARGALIKPWLPTEIKERRHWDISASERLDILKNFCSVGLTHWGSDSRGVETTRRFLLEWLSYLCRYVPVGLLEVVPAHIQWRPLPYYGRNDLETLLGSDSAADWVKISEMLLGPVPTGFAFAPKHKSNAYSTESASLVGAQTTTAKENDVENE